MNRYDAETLYKLLPAIYRQQDAKRGEPLKQLIAVLAEEAEVVARDIERLADNSFVETCDEWAVPYIGDLLGVRGPRSGNATSARAEVANTIGYRRRKGTPSMLEQLARDVTSWPARVVEFFELLALSGHMNHVRSDRGGVASIRQAHRMELVDGAFDRTAHSVDVRRIPPREGRHSIMNLGLFMFRIAAWPQLLLSPRQVVDETGADKPGAFTFSPLGHDSPLFNNPATETATTSIAREINLPVPIRRRALHDDLSSSGKKLEQGGSSDYCGPGRSIVLLQASADDWIPVDGQYVACDLSEWDRSLPPAVIAVDPVLGRVRFSKPDDVPESLRLSTYYGFPADLGGGQYDRSESMRLLVGEQNHVEFQVGDPNDPRLRRHPSIDTRSANFSDSLADALDAVQSNWPENETRVLRIVDSRTYEETIPEVGIPSGSTLVLLADDGQRPTVLLGDELAFSGGSQSGLVIDGVWIGGQPLALRSGPGGAGIDEVVLRHLTLVPGLSLNSDGSPTTPGAVSLRVETNDTEVRIERCILGGVRTAPETSTQMRESILDVHRADALAYGAHGSESHGGPLTVSRSTIVGQIHAAAIRRAENSLLLGSVVAERRQEGCVRYCWVAVGSRVPRRYRCQPEIPDNANEEEVRRLVARLSPCFTSLRYGQAAYAQLDWRAPREVLRGAEDGSEMGVFSILQQPQREDHLRLRLEEYLPVGLQAGILYAT